MVGAGNKVTFVGPSAGVYEHATQSSESNDYYYPKFSKSHAAKWGAWMSFPVWTTNHLMTTYQPDILILMLGTNDLYNGVTPSELIGVATAVINDARAVNPRIKIVLGQVPNTTIVGSGTYNTSLIGLESMSTPQSPIVTTRPTAFTLATHTYDNSHPTNAGEVRIARSVVTALNKMCIAANSIPNDNTIGPAETAVLSVVKSNNKEVTLKWTKGPDCTWTTIWRQINGGAWTGLTGSGGNTLTTPMDAAGTYKYRVQLHRFNSISPKFSNVVTRTRA